MMRNAFLGAVFAAALALPAHAEKLTPERVFADPDLSGPVAKGVAISPDGKLATFLRAKATDQTVQDLWAIPTAGGEARLLVDAAALEPKGQELSEAEKARRERQRISARGIVEYKWDEQGKALLVPAGGDLYLADPATGAVKRLTQTPGDETDSRFSRRGGYVSFVRDANLYVMPAAGGAERAITTGGGGAISYGTAEFVAQEEMERFTGYWWAPDDTRIAYTRVDESGVDVIPRLEIGATGSTLVNQRYPRAGRPNAVVQLFVQALAGGAPVQVDLGADADVYLARANWSEDGRTLYVQRETRDQTRLDLLSVDPATGAARVILTEVQKPWINLNDNFHPLKDGTFLWTSERSGFSHIYLFTRDGQMIRQVTHGDWPAGGRAAAAGLQAPGVQAADEAKGLVYFRGSRESPLQQSLYVVSYRKPGEPVRLTQGEGWFDTAVAHDAKSFVATYSDPKTPPQTALYDISGRRLRWIEENLLSATHPYFPFLDHHATPQYGTIKAADGSDLYYSMVKPTDFDPAKRYPAIVQVYGGPDSLDFRKAWSPALNQLYPANGFIVFQLENRGGANRGVKFAGALAGRLGSVEVTDQLAGIAWLKSQPFVDPARVGITGWSYGGYMTLRLLTEPGAGLKAGASGAAPSDWRLYDTHYTERFMGKPQDRDAAYTESALLPRLKNLGGRLLYMQGMSDDNVIFANGTAIINGLQELSTPFDLMLYPGQRHGIRTPPRQLQLWRTYLAFFKRELGGPATVAPAAPR